MFVMYYENKIDNKMSLKSLISNSIDWLSVKITLVSWLGFLVDDYNTKILAALATISAIIYNTIRIYQTFKSKKKEGD